MMRLYEKLHTVFFCPFHFTQILQKQYISLVFTDIASCYPLIVKKMKKTVTEIHRRQINSLRTDVEQRRGE